MRFIIEKDYNYFCCSSLSLLNGDIKTLIDGNTQVIIGARIKYHPIEFKVMLELILTFLRLEYYNYKYKMYRKLKLEYKRLIRLYEFRIKLLDRSE